jgi:stress-induced-phosphoprotein 1
LTDAVKCVELRPDWGKGYLRKGAAEHSLGRFDQAIATYKIALRMDPTDQSLMVAASNPLPPTDL